jgi:hypothetical protein
MTLEELAYLSQIIGVFAVFGSLIFVGIQMRAQARETRYGVMNQILTDYQQLLNSLVEDPVLAQDSFDAAEGGFSAVAPERRARMLYGITLSLRLFERAVIQYKAGRLGDDAWQSVHGSLVPLLGSRAIRDYWQLRKSTFSPAFVAFVENEMASASPYRRVLETESAPSPQSATGELGNQRP